MDNSPKIRVMLVDDHAHIHQAIAKVLSTVDDIRLIAQCGNGEEAILLTAQYQPDVILMDIVMPVMDGIEATERILQNYPQAKILALTSFQDDETVHAMFAKGAVGYIMKGALLRDLVNTIRTVYQGNTVLSSEAARVLLNATQPQQRDFKLTSRELEILKAMAAGQNNGEIAARFVISQSTVKFHIVNILQKMGVETRSEAIVLAAKNNLV